MIKQSKTPLGVYWQSLFGVRFKFWKVKGILLFQDEATFYGYPDPTGAWDDDLAEFNAAAAAWAAPLPIMVIAHVRGVSGGWGPLWPDGEALPDPIKYRQVFRPPTSMQLEDLYEDFFLLPTSQPLITDLTIIIDESGSMTREDIEPTINTFESYVSASGMGYEEVLFTSERYLGMFTLYGLTP